MRVRVDHLSIPRPGSESLCEVYRRMRSVAADFRDDMTRGQHLAARGHHRSNRMLAAVRHSIPLDAVFESRDYKPRNASTVELRPAANGGDDFSLRHGAAGRP